MTARMSKKLSVREQSILLGLYLSKFDFAGVKALGFSSFSEVYNAFALAIGTKPATIKNYRDELDPYFPNSRKGWHQRTLRGHCAQVLEDYKNTDIETLQNMISSFVSTPLAESDEEAGRKSSFAKRLITGKSAENFFVENYAKEPIFQVAELEDVTQTGCGYDFRLYNKSISEFFAVEVKGLHMASGSFAMTEKEYRKAGEIGDRYFLYIVRNFEDTPEAMNIRNPIKSYLTFNRCERVVVQVSWRASV